MMPVKHVSYFCIVAVQGLAQETVNEAELECIHGTGLCYVMRRWMHEQ